MTALTARNAASADLVPHCSFCGSPSGSPCVTRSGEWARTTHAVRAKLARALAAHADPVLDVFFPQLGPCGICGVPGLDQRHRVIDAIAERLTAGEDTCEVAGDYGLRTEAVRVVAAWSRRWPGAWG